MRAEEILVDGVIVIRDGLWLDWRVILSACMLLEVAILDVGVAHAAALCRSCGTSTFLRIWILYCQHGLSVLRVIISQERLRRARIAVTRGPSKCRDSHVSSDL